MDLEVVAARAVGADESPRARADVVLDDDVGGRAELARELDGVAAAELEVPFAGDPAAERIDMAELGADHGARKATCARRAPRCGLADGQRARLLGLERLAGAQAL